MTTQFQSNASSTSILVNGQVAAVIGTGGLANNPQTISVSMAANAVTIAALNSVPLTFRSATATDGSTSIVVTPSSNLVIPSGATLGTVNAVQSTIVVVEMNNGGTREFAVCNISGGLQLDEQNLISTTAIDTASDSANVWYSTTARSSLPYRVVGTFTSTQATAGTWATSASAVQSAFGEAMMSVGSAGYGQTWQDVTGSRAMATTYYNTTGKEILVSFGGAGAAAAAWPQGNVNGAAVGAGSGSQGIGGQTICNFSVPPGASYSVTNGYGTITLNKWSERR